MNKEFLENYFNHFLTLSKKNLKKDIDEGSNEEAVSPYVRALIKRYVDFYKKKMIKESEE